MGERPDFNRVVIDSIVRKVQHERNCGCMRCMGKARQSIAWANELSPEAEREDARREQVVIDRMSKTETSEERDLRMMNMLGEPDIERLLAYAGQNYSGLVRLMEGDPGDEQFFG